MPPNDPSLFDELILYCPCCGAQFSVDADGTGVCEVTGLTLPAQLVARLRTAFPVKEEVEHTLNDDYFDARWYCPSCRSALATDDSICPRCRKGVREFAAELLAANPTRCSRRNN